MWVDIETGEILKRFEISDQFHGQIKESSMAVIPHEVIKPPLIFLVSSSSQDEYRVSRYQSEGLVNYYYPPRDDTHWRIINAMHYLP
jgi:hypothetical protein